MRHLSGRILRLAIVVALTAAARAERVELWNGRDLTGWKLFLQDPAADPASAWSTREGVLRLDSKSLGYLRTEKSFSNYHLHLEWRWQPDAASSANSGVMVHLNGPDQIWPACFECQLKTGDAGQFVGIGLDIPAAPLINNRKRAPRLAPSSEKPHGGWNRYDIYARGDSVEVFVNGVRQNVAEQLPVSAGAIALQLEGTPVEFRSLWLETPPPENSTKAMLTSQVYDWQKLAAVPTKNGLRRDVFDGPTTTVDRAHCHITTLNPGEVSSEPHRHLQEEIIIVKEGEVEAYIDGRTQIAGPGSVFFLAANAVTRLRNAGTAPATYFVVMYYTPLTPKK
ncbi:MAG TPA: family 16 glycoside hydrolase [Opitutaceae bacterium]